MQYSKYLEQKITVLYNVRSRGSVYSTIYSQMCFRSQIDRECLKRGRWKGCLE